MAVANFNQEWNQTTESSQKMQIVKKCEIELDQCLQMKGKSANLFCIRAVLRAYQGNFQGALRDIDRAIDKSEDNQPEHFFVRALLFASFDKIKQAIKDLTTAIHFNPSYSDAYLQRAKCY